MGSILNVQETKRFLLVTRVGRKSLHRQFLVQDDARNFDILISCYDKTVRPDKSPGVFWEYRPGRKVEGYQGILKEKGGLLAKYDYVGFWDEDLEASVPLLNRMFGLGASHDLKIFQPALTWDSYFTYGAMLRQPGLSLRWVNFIEMMAPVFRRDVLVRIAPLFDLGYESGIDLVWCNLVAESPRDFAILDATPIRHTEPVGGNKADNGFVGGSEYEDHIQAVLNEFDLPWLSCVPFAALTGSGRILTSRLGFLTHAAPLLTAAPLQRPLGHRFRSILVHLRHLAVLRAQNIPVSMAKAVPRATGI